MRRLERIMQELDFDEPTVTMLVELSDSGKLECTWKRPALNPYWSQLQTLMISKL